MYWIQVCTWKWVRHRESTIKQGKVNVRYIALGGAKLTEWAEWVHSEDSEQNMLILLHSSQAVLPIWLWLTMQVHRGSERRPTASGGELRHSCCRPRRSEPADFKQGQAPLSLCTSVVSQKECQKCTAFLSCCLAVCCPKGNTVMLSYKYCKMKHGWN